MSVVIRCPKCGTTSTSLGECDACHDAQVRYFCTNHEPGLWLETRTCPACAARREEVIRRPSVVASTVPVRRSSVPARAPRSLPSPPHARPDPYAREAPEVARFPSSDRWDDERLHAADEELAPIALRGPMWQKILRAALVARSMRLPAAPVSEGRSLRRLGGCLVRLLLMAVVLIAALVSGLYLYGRSLLELLNVG